MTRTRIGTYEGKDVHIFMKAYTAFMIENFGATYSAEVDGNNAFALTVTTDKQLNQARSAMLTFSTKGFVAGWSCDKRLFGEGREES